MNGLGTRLSKSRSLSEGFVKLNALTRNVKRI